MTAGHALLDGAVAGHGLQDGVVADHAPLDEAAASEVPIKERQCSADGMVRTRPTTPWTAWPFAGNSRSPWPPASRRETRDLRMQAERRGRISTELSAARGSCKVDPESSLFLRARTGIGAVVSRQDRHLGEDAGLQATRVGARGERLRGRASFLLRRQGGGQRREFPPYFSASLCRLQRAPALYANYAGPNDGYRYDASEDERWATSEWQYSEEQQYFPETHEYGLAAREGAFREGYGDTIGGYGPGHFSAGGEIFPM